MAQTSVNTPENIRPWGRYDILEVGNGFKVKQITVNPGKQLSYQRHEHRSEYWTVVSGQAVVTLDGKQSKKKAGDTIVSLKGSAHRIKNTGATPLIFIEVQLGDYLGEDDIERIEDDYGRA